jgi:hypothetical protein
VTVPEIGAAFVIVSPPIKRATINSATFTFFLNVVKDVLFVINLCLDLKMNTKYC